MKIPACFVDQDRLIVLRKTTFENKEGFPGIRLMADGWSVKIAHSKQWGKPVTVVIPGFKSPSTLRLSVIPGVSARIDLVYLLADDQTDIRIELSVPQNSTLRLANLFLGEDCPSIQITRTGGVGESGRLELHTGILAGSVSRLTDDFTLEGPHAVFEADFLAVAGGNAHFNAIQSIHHRRPATESRLLNLLIAVGSAKMNVDVTGTIEKGNAKSICHQQNRGLILEETGSISVEPKLVIDEYDVDAGHGCAIGQISADELYYLASRGLDESTAKRLIISGYLSPILTQISNPSFSRFFAKKLEDQLKRGKL